MTRHVVLIGPMGAGKSTVGRLLARDLGRPLWDNDVELVRVTGRQLAELVELPRDALHALEHDVLRAGLSQMEPHVVTAAGSVVRADDEVRTAVARAEAG